MGNGLFKADYCIYEEDFIDTTVVDSTLDDLSAPWKWTASGVGADIPNRASFKDEAFGVMRVSTGSADNSYVTGQMPTEWIIPAAGKRILFKTRLNMTSATQSELMIGVMDNAATDLFGGIQDGFYFRKDDGDTNIDFVHEAAATAVVQTAVAVVAADTDVTLAFEWQSTGSGSGWLWVYVDGSPVNGLNGLEVASGAPSALMGLGVGIKAGEAVQSHVDLDYLGVVLER